MAEVEEPVRTAAVAAEIFDEEVMMSAKPYYITTPIYYVNGLPHVGSALTTVSCDVLARYHKLRGEETFLLTGTDENATKVQEAAEKANLPTQQFVDGLAEAFAECWRRLHIEYDVFMRTTAPQHIRAVQEFFRRLQEKDCIYLDNYEGWYSVSDETFYRDTDVKDGFAIETGKPVVRVQEPNYFFRLSAFGDKILEHIAQNPDWLQPEFRKNEVIGFINEGLRDMSIARSVRAAKGWGIPVPGDDTQIIYVWFDALINYLAATGWPDNPDWDRLFPADTHFMGKEIFVRFHATLWPAMLMALDLPLPKHVYAHGWWTIGGTKGGKTGPPLPHPTRFTEFVAERSGTDFETAADAVRYVLCREMNFGVDVEFTVENCLRRYNVDLANDLGNLTNRTVNMLLKFCDGTIPNVTEYDPEIVALSEQVQVDYVAALSEFRLNTALEAAWRLVGRMNKYIDEKSPWALAKAGDPASRAALELTLYSCLEAVRVVSILAQPFLPVATLALRRQIGIPDTTLPQWSDLGWGGLPVGTVLPPPQPLFPRIQDVTTDEQTLTRLASSTTDPEENQAIKETIQTVSETTPAPGTPVDPETLKPAEPEFISIDDFMKVELRVAQILEAESVPNATKLLRLTVQSGEDETRTILAGIAEYYAPETLIGRKIVIVANLQPRKMRGIESQGMLLAADVEGKAVILAPDENAPIGSRVR